MKKVLIPLIIVLLFSLTGCSLLPDKSIETLKGWSFQYNQGTNDFSLFFGLLNGNEQYISADVDVDIRIVNESGEEVYKATKSVTKRDFGNYESKAAGKQYLAEIRIPEKDIATGKSSNGTVYLTVYKENVVQFDEVNCAALYCLPVSDLTLVAENLPTEISVKGYDGSVESKIRIEDVSYTCDKLLSTTLKITVSGTKTYGSSKIGYDMVAYKIYDSKGYVVESGNLFINGVGKGDKFKDDSISVYDITPGDIYKIVFSECRY